MAVSNCKNAIYSKLDVLKNIYDQKNELHKKNVEDYEKEVQKLKALLMEKEKALCLSEKKNEQLSAQLAALTLGKDEEILKHATLIVGDDGHTSKHAATIFEKDQEISELAANKDANNLKLYEGLTNLEMDLIALNKDLKETKRDFALAKIRNSDEVCYHLRLELGECLIELEEIKEKLDFYKKDAKMHRDMYKLLNVKFKQAEWDIEYFNDQVMSQYEFIDDLKLMLVENGCRDFEPEEYVDSDLYENEEERENIIAKNRPPGRNNSCRRPSFNLQPTLEVDEKGEVQPEGREKKKKSKSCFTLAYFMRCLKGRREA